MLFKKQFFNVAEDYHKLVSFIEAINHLANLNSGFDIVLRPHPLENVEAWKKYLYGIPNVHVIREGRLIHGLIMLLQLCIIVVLQR